MASIYNSGMRDAEMNISELEEKYGKPLEVSMQHELRPFEFNVVKFSMRNGREHDVTMFIRKKDDPQKIAVIRKHFFPQGAYRAPSGAARPPENLEEGIIRETMEETGLLIDIKRYILRIKALFTCKGKKIDWTTHVFEAVEKEGVLAPHDTDEIEEARWASLDELQGKIRDKLLETDWELFRYRVALTDLAIEQMEGSP